MPRIIYLTVERAIETYKKTIDMSGGGTCGFIADGMERLKGILEFIQDDFYYPTIEEKLTHLFFPFASFTCFRTGIREWP
ncbi:hypothetical protein [Aminivibrio sp.]|jgi:death-on-curing protein|uniref:hypothetical protein n=1 Tax=Aminivibrio sp. TaxID=1872489 RepID=UPI001A4FCE40|nr:hypothetical protein [Aminivibrio sp.]MBL3539717.1 hypothetical protein [Aminivibrio sp.]